MDLQNTEHTSNQINIKLVLLGDGNVGKTSLVNYFLKKNFLKRYIPTIGSIILKKEYKLDNNTQIKVNIWDIGGQKSFNPLNPTFYTNVDAAYLVFDLSKPKETLANIKNDFLKNLEKYAKDCQTIVIGNKLDLISLEKDLEKIIKKFFSDNVPLIITSARTGQNVIESFEFLIYNFLLDREVKFPSDNYKGVSIRYLEYIGKNKEELINKLLNIDNLKSIKFKKSINKQEEISVEIDEFNIKREVIVAPNTDAKIIDKYIPIKQEIKEVETYKDEIINEFNKDITKIEELVLNLKKTPIDLLLDRIEETKNHIEKIKENFKINLESIIYLGNNDEHKK